MFGHQIPLVRLLIISVFFLIFSIPRIYYICKFTILHRCLVSTPVTNINDIGHDTVSLHGIALPYQNQLAETASGAPCLWYCNRVFSYLSRRFVSNIYASTMPFILKDSTGSVLVMPPASFSDVDVLLNHYSLFEELFIFNMDNYIWFSESKNFNDQLTDSYPLLSWNYMAAWRNYIWNEMVIKPGNEVFVYGTFVPARTDDLSGKVECGGFTPTSFVLFRGPRNEVLKSVTSKIILGFFVLILISIATYFLDLILISIQV